MSKITTGQMYSQWEQMNQKLEALDNKIDGIIDGTTPANTQLIGSIVELVGERDVTITPGSIYNILNTVDVSDYKEIIIHGNNVGSIETRLLRRSQGSINLDLAVLTSTDFPVIHKVSSVRLLVTVRNTSDSDVTTNLACMGVR